MPNNGSRICVCTCARRFSLQTQTLTKKAEKLIKYASLYQFINATFHYVPIYNQSDD